MTANLKEWQDSSSEILFSLKANDPALVMVVWEDITNTADWADAEQVREWRNFEFDHHCVSVGFMVENKPDHIILSAQITKDWKALAMSSRIPKGCIKHVVNLVNGHVYAP